MGKTLLFGNYGVMVPLKQRKEESYTKPISITMVDYRAVFVLQTLLNLLEILR